MMVKVVIIGPAYPLRGGLATFNQRLAREFTQSGYDCSIYSFSLQYPSFLFPGKTQYSKEPAPAGIKIHTAINSVNPFNWIKIGNRLRKEKPDLVLLDVMMPGIDGMEVCTKMRQMDGMDKAIIAFLTARSEDYSHIAGFDAGADDYLIKPLDSLELKGRLRSGRRILDLQAGAKTLRLNFPERVTGPGELPKMLAKLADEARAKS